MIPDYDVVDDSDVVAAAAAVAEIDVCAGSRCYDVTNDGEEVEEEVAEYVVEEWS